jgi:hypothetical protein
MEPMPCNHETVSTRLQALLESARDANNACANRVSLQDFLARLQAEAEVAEDVQLKQTQACLRKLRGVLLIAC